MSETHKIDKTIRPTKKQRDILIFIEQFIGEHGYSPSYREIMNGLHYTSVATVSLHINSLIKRGHLHKRDHSARSLEVVSADGAAQASRVPASGGEAWLVEKIEQVFQQVEQGAAAAEAADLAALVHALKLLGLDTAAGTYAARLQELRTRFSAEPRPAAGAAA